MESGIGMKWGVASVPAANVFVDKVGGGKFFDIKITAVKVAKIGCQKKKTDGIQYGIQPYASYQIIPAIFLTHMVSVTPCMLGDT